MENGTTLQISKNTLGRFNKLPRIGKETQDQVLGRLIDEYEKNRE